MVKFKKMFIVMMIVLTACLLVAMCFDVKASGVLDISDDFSLDNPDQNSQNELNALDINATGDVGENSQVIQPTTNTLEENNTDDELPKTGVTEDITVMFFIVVCVVSAIFAYKKIRDYKA